MGQGAALLIELFEFRCSFVCFSSALLRDFPTIGCGLLGALRIPLFSSCPGCSFRYRAIGPYAGGVHPATGSFQVP